jgi:hypothetical protein
MMASSLSEIRDVLKHVETNYNPDLIGDSGKSFGILQIQQGAIDDVNRVYGTDYIHQDAFDINCAEEIFELYIKLWTSKLEKRQNRAATEEDIVRIWNGGPQGWRRDSTLDYLKKYKYYKAELAKQIDMKRKYFTKEVTSYQFKLSTLDKMKDIELKQESKEKLWRAFLILMADEKLIGAHSAKTWTYPVEYI